MASVPTAAASVGYNTQTLGPAVTVGTNWWRSNMYGIDPNSVNVTQNPTGSVTLAGPWTYNSQIMTTSLTGDGGFTGIAFGGGAYFEATLSFSGTYTGAGGWPSFWSHDVEGLLGNGSTQWAGQPAGYTDEIEPDFMEYWGGDTWGSTIHNWYGGGDVLETDRNFTLSGGAVASDPHRYGALWVPATATSRGTMSYYFDGVHIDGWDISWDQYNPALSPAPVRGSSAYSVMDSLHLTLILGSGASNPMTVYSVEVWQNSSDNNISTLPKPPTVIVDPPIEPQPPLTSVVTGSGPDSLVLQISEDAFVNADGTSTAGNATFTVSIDGKQQGATFTALGSHSAGTEQLFTFKGSFGTGPHNVAVTFLNDAYSPSAPDAKGSIDRNLYVDNVTYAGADTKQSAALYDGSTKTFTVTGGTAQPTSVITGSGPDSLVLRISEDAFANNDGTSDAAGDATFTVAIDGKQLGGTFTALAAHAAGTNQTFTFNGYFGTGSHTVTTTFLNDAWNASGDRNLFIGGVTYKGTDTNQSATLWSAGSQNFAISGGTLPVADGTNLTLTGTMGNDTLTGGTGNDTLVGRAGADMMTGGAGNDAYQVDNAGDVVRETVGGGTDTVWASVGYALGAGCEVEGLRANAGATGLTLTGNAFANTLVGGTGNDALNGGGGNDTLSGKAGADVMTGGAGDDAYVVDNAGDRALEGVGGGTDTVWANVNNTLAAGSEIEFLRNAGATGLTLTGNEFANTVVGNGGNDTLLGGAGNDVLNGRAGNDVLTGGVGDDMMTGGTETDIFKFSTGFGHDIITDFDSNPVGGQDLLDISALGIKAATFAGSVNIAASGSSTLISIGVNSMRLSGVVAGTIDSADFRLAA